MGLMSILIFLAIGAVAGWLAGTLMKGQGYGLPGNILLGIIGALFGGWLFNAFGISIGGLIGSFVTAVVGASLLLFIAGLVKK
jgi:uncharacterized membrane protein YeaQ/YmgE (transglycosylase-associated protein family)